MSENNGHSLDLESGEIPSGNLAGLKSYWKKDLLAGFLVFLIALPLCLSIALAYGFPPIAGVFTAIIGGIVATFISNSELTIKGPAAGLIAIAAPCVMSFGWNGVPGELNLEAYRAALAVGVAAGALQILMGVFRVGSLGELFPPSVVHGMLAAIGVIILIKMFPLALGVKVGGKPGEILLGIPEIVRNSQSSIAIIGITSVAIMFLWPLVKVKFLSAVPAAMVVLAVTIPMAKVMDLGGMHTNSVSLKKDAAENSTASNETDAARKSDTLIHVPEFGETFSALTFPKFDALLEAQAWRWVLMFALIGTLESMLSARAMDLIDPWQRRTSLDRDNIAIGVGNTLCAFIGAAPMISEIVRSRANMDNGAQTRFANLYHGIFLLLFVTLLPFVIGMIPIAALMAMLVYTGYRLAHPKEFVHVYKVGPEQLVIYTSTLVGCIAIDLLAGVAIGIGVTLLIHLVNGVPIGSLFRPGVTVNEKGNGSIVLNVKRSAIFSNWLGLKKRIEKTNGATEVVLDLSETRLVDHTVMANLYALKAAFEKRDCRLVITGLEQHRAVSEHPYAARKKKTVQSTPQEVLR